MSALPGVGCAYRECRGVGGVAALLAYRPSWGPLVFLPSACLSSGNASLVVKCLRCSAGGRL